jgi:predicted RNA-binding protein (virulence factor B family)
MPEIGQRATLTIVREKPVGLFLDAEELGEILLPRREMPVKWELGEPVDVFLYHDSEDRPVATLKEPLVKANEFARLKCVAVTNYGAFLNWGLPKDLMVPFREQKVRLEVGKFYLVHVHVDQETGRVIASTRLARYLDLSIPPYKGGEEVQLMLYGKTDLGYKAIIDNAYSGLLFANEVFQEMQQGEKLKGYIAARRDDGKLDLTLHPPGRQRVDDLQSRILAELQARGGFWSLGDHSSAAEIHEELGVSKRTFKQATGALFRQRKIDIEPKGIRSIKNSPPA